MLLTDYIHQEDIICDFRASGKAQALEKLCRFASERHNLPFEELLKVVRNREELGSTGLGGGVALPHGKSPAVKTPVLVVAAAREGVEFDSLDGQPVRLFVLMITPPDGGGLHLKLLARLGALLKSPEAIADLLGGSCPADIHGFLARRAA